MAKKKTDGSRQDFEVKERTIDGTRVTEVVGVFPTYDGYPPFEVRMALAPFDWRRLEYYWFEMNNTFEPDFTLMILHATEQMAPKPRGKSGKDSGLIRKIKGSAPYLYMYLKHFLDGPVAKYPESVSVILREANKEAKDRDDPDRFVKSRGHTKEAASYDPVLLTAYCIQRIYGTMTNDHAFFSFDDDEWDSQSFYVTYLSGSLNKIRSASRTISKRSGESVAVYLAHQAEGILDAFMDATES